MSKGTILVVDDEKDIREILEYNFRREGYEVLTACDGREALDIVQLSLPDLIILDVMMPEIDGFEVCRRLRDNPNTSALPVIVLSAKLREFDDLVRLELGATEYIQKPVSPRVLVHRVDYYLH